MTWGSAVSLLMSKMIHVGGAFGSMAFPRSPMSVATAFGLFSAAAIFFQLSTRRMVSRLAIATNANTLS